MSAELGRTRRPYLVRIRTPGSRVEGGISDVILIEALIDHDQPSAFPSAAGWCRGARASRHAIRG